MIARKEGEQQRANIVTSAGSQADCVDSDRAAPARLWSQPVSETQEKEGTVMPLFARRAASARRWPGRPGLWIALCAGVLIAASLAALSGAVKAAGIKKNGKIAFVTLRDQFDQEIYSMDPDGSAPTRLTNSRGADVEPAWSPDGAKIAFHSERDGNAEIYVMNADGSNPINLTKSPATVADTHRTQPTT
jgi:hypothetical protein